MNRLQKLYKLEALFKVGSHKETHILDVNQAVPYMRFPVYVNPKNVTFFALTRVALGAVHDANPIIGDSVGVVGLGVVGQLSVQLLAKTGVRKLVGIDNNPDRLALAAQYGATPINFSCGDPAKIIKENGGSLDIVIEASGTYSGLTTAIKCLTPMGKVVVVSSYGNQSKGIQLGHEFHRNRITLVSSMTINECTHPKFPLWNLERLNNESARLLIDGALSTDKLISQVIPFSNAIHAFENMMSTPNPPLKILFDYE
jgi:threonine dehydrogenase-like Zn-dependent dehydrogenase